MKKFNIPLGTKSICFAFFASFALLATGCGKSGALEDPISYVTPSISNLQTQSTNVAKCTGGVLNFSFDWTSPQVVSNARAYLGFVRTIDLPVTEPKGYMGNASDTPQPQQNTPRYAIDETQIRGAEATITNGGNPYINCFSSVRFAPDNADIASEPVNTPESIADFYRKYEKPILIPVTIGTQKTSGNFYAEVPFTTGDIASAPLGVHQMMVYMQINGYKTNTLSFEMTFVP